MIKRLLEDIERLNFRDYSEMQFNLYEDEEVYSAEVVFDEDALIIGREDTSDEYRISFSMRLIWKTKDM